MKQLIALLCVVFLHLLLAAPSPQLTGEIRSYHQVGDKIKGEFARLHPDGSVTKTLAFGDTKQGLQYKTFQMDPQGNVKPLDFPQGQAPSQLNSPQDPAQQQLTQGQDPGQTQMTQQNPQAASGAVPPGVNWFMSQGIPGVTPVAVDPFAAPDPFQQPGVQDPFFNNPWWNPWTI